jgi:hypothetical protein
VPADGYPGGRVTANARPKTNVSERGRDQAAKDAKALMQAIPESSLALRVTQFSSAHDFEGESPSSKAAYRPSAFKSSKCRIVGIQRSL